MDLGVSDRRECRCEKRRKVVERRAFRAPSAAGTAAAPRSTALERFEDVGDVVADLVQVALHELLIVAAHHADA